MTDKVKKLKGEFGSVIFSGKEYVLIQQAYFTDSPNSDGWYEAEAILSNAKPDEFGGYDTYLVTWSILPETLAQWSADCESNCWTDESNACDWDNPESIKPYYGRTWLSFKPVFYSLKTTALAKFRREKMI